MVGAITGNAFGTARRAAGVPSKAGGAVVHPAIYGAGSWTFAPAVGGLYSFRIWGPGATGVAYGNPEDGGGGGAYCKRTVRLSAGASVPITVGSSSNGVASTATFSDKTMTAGAGVQNYTSIAVATGGDINLNGGAAGAGNSNGVVGPPTKGAGSNPGSVGVSQAYYGAGASAPGDDMLRGGNGGNAGDLNGNYTATNGTFPGGGGGSGKSSFGFGADGFCIVIYEGP